MDRKRELPSFLPVRSAAPYVPGSSQSSERFFVKIGRLASSYLTAKLSALTRYYVCAVYYRDTVMYECGYNLRLSVSGRVCHS